MKKTLLNVLVTLGIAFFLCFQGNTETLAAQWQLMTIPGLPEGTELRDVWTSGPNDTYIWARRTTPGTTDVPEATLYHWDGAEWDVVLSLPGHGAGDGAFKRVFKVKI